MTCTLNVLVIGQVDINREFVSLLSTGPLASFCLFTTDLMLYCMMLLDSCVMSCYDSNKTGSISTFIVQEIMPFNLHLKAIVILQNGEKHRTS